MSGSDREQTIEATAKQFYDGVLGGDWEKVVASVHPDFVVSQAAGLPYGGDYNGLEGLQAMFGELVTVYFEDAAFELIELFASEQHAIARFHISGKIRKSGKTFETELLELVKFHNGKISHIKPFYYDSKQISDLLN